MVVATWEMKYLYRRGGRRKKYVRRDVVQKRYKGGKKLVNERREYGGGNATHPPVVTDEEHGPLVVLERLLEHLLGGNVQVVRRLVEHQQIGGLEHHAAERDTPLLAAAQVPNFFLHVVALEEELAQERPQLLVALRGGGLGDDVDNRVVQVERVGLVLLEVLEHDVVPDGRRPFLGGLLPHEAPQERGLARAVGAQERDAVRGLHHQPYVLE